MQRQKSPDPICIPQNTSWSCHKKQQWNQSNEPTLQLQKIGKQPKKPPSSGSPIALCRTSRRSLILRALNAQSCSAKTLSTSLASYWLQRYLLFWKKTAAWWNKGCGIENGNQFGNFSNSLKRAEIFNPSPKSWDRSSTLFPVLVGVSLLVFFKLSHCRQKQNQWAQKTGNFCSRCWVRQITQTIEELPLLVQRTGILHHPCTGDARFSAKFSPPNTLSQRIRLETWDWLKS